RAGNSRIWRLRTHGHYGRTDHAARLRIARLVDAALRILSPGGRDRVDPRQHGGRRVAALVPDQRRGLLLCAWPATYAGGRGSAHRFAVPAAAAGSASPPDGRSGWCNKVIAAKLPDGQEMCRWSLAALSAGRFVLRARVDPPT